MSNTLVHIPNARIAIMEIVQNAGAKFALPGKSIYMEGEATELTN